MATRLAIPQPRPTSPLHNPEMISPATNDPPEIPIVLLWQHLASMDRQSPDFLPLLSTLTAGDNRLSTTTLRDNGCRDRS